MKKAIGIKAETEPDAPTPKDDVVRSVETTSIDPDNLEFETLDQLLAVAKARTERERARAAEEAEKPTKKSKLKVELETALGRSSFGCQQAHVNALMAAFLHYLTGEKLDMKEKDGFASGLVAITLIVPLEAKGAHDWPLSSVGLVTNTAEAYGLIGKHLDRSNHLYGSWRYATPAEVDSFIDEARGLPKTEKLAAVLAALKHNKY